jgi:hypothetical protein
MNPKMPSEYTILETMKDYYEADIKNPMAFHNHDAFYEAVESKLKQLMESQNYIDGLNIVKKIMENNE